MNKEIRPVSGVSDPKAVERLNDANSRRAADRQNLTKGAERAKPATPVSRDGSTLEQFGAQVPPEFSSSPQKMQTEWGWRRFIVQTLNEEQPTVAQGMQQQETTAANGNGELTQKMVQTLWQTLQPLLQESALQGQEIPVANWMTPGMLLPLSYVEEQHVNDPKMPEKVKRMAIAEKMQVAVQSPSLPIVGGGLFYPPIQAFEERRQAVYFEAERQHVMSADGQHAQHLLIKIKLDEKPMELHFIFSSAALSLHIRTDDEQLREDLSAYQLVAKTSLQLLGWDMSQFSVGKLTETKGEL